MVCCLAALLPALRATAQATCAVATSIPIGSVFNGNSAGSPGDGFTGLCAPTNAAVWHTFVPTVSGTHTISLCSSAIDSVAALYSSCGPAPTFLTCDDDTCGDDAVLVYTLTAGQTYYLRVASKNATPGGAYSVFISAPPAAAPSNDFCGSPFSLPLNTPFAATSVPTVGSDLSACGSLDTSDVWFTLNAGTPGQYLIQACSRAFQPVISIHASCGAASSIACTSSGSAVGCTSGGSASLAYTPPSTGNVLVRLSGVRGSFGDFTITAYAPRANDLCSAPTPIILGTPATGSTSPALTTDTSVACGASSFDVWHTFIAPQSGLYSFSTCTGTDFDTVLSIHSACPSSPSSTVLACNDNACSSGSSVSLSLTGGTVIWIRIAGKNGAFGNYTLSSSILTPANDLCSAATTLLEGVPLAGNSAGATGTDISSCGTDDSKDVWFSFVPAVTSDYEFHTCGSSIDTVLSLYASCAGAELACSDNAPTFCGPGASATGSTITASLSAGVAYKLRLAGSNAGEGAYQLAVSRLAPANDQCVSATPLSLGVTVSSTLTGATISGASACSRPAAPDVWFSFTPAITRHYRVQTCGSIASTVVSIHASCNPNENPGCGLASPEVCPTGGSSAVSLMLAGTTYRIQVADAGNSVYGGAIQVQIVPGTPDNDACISPATLPLNIATPGSNLDATTDGAETCAAGGSDVWFAFTPTQSGFYRFRTCAGPTTLDTILSLHLGCDLAPFACSDNNTTVCGPSSTASAFSARLTAGTTYLLRVAGRNSAQGSFTLDATSTAPTNDACANATPVANGSYPYDTLAATTDPISLNSSCSLPFTIIQSDIWFRYTAPATGETTVSLCGSNFDTALAISSAVGGCVPPGGVSTSLACNDDAACAPPSTALTPQSRASFNAVAGQPYFIRVGSQSGVTGSGTLNISQGTTCPCDWNHNNQLEVQDIFDFLNAWFAGAGDFNSSGTLDTNDIFDFLNCWLAAAPPCGS
jgi:hypothetical protein